MYIYGYMHLTSKWDLKRAPEIETWRIKMSREYSPKIHTYYHIETWRQIVHSTLTAPNWKTQVYINFWGNKQSNKMKCNSIVTRNIILIHEWYTRGCVYVLKTYKMKEIRLKIPIRARSQLHGMSRKCKSLEKRKKTSPGVPGAGKLIDGNIAQSPMVTLRSSVSLAENYSSFCKDLRTSGYCFQLLDPKSTCKHNIWKFQVPQGLHSLYEQ